jgi:hypothetical protein
MYPQLILRLMESCEQALNQGADREEVRSRLLPAMARRALRQVQARDFLQWAETDPDYGQYCREVQACGLGSSPVETAQMILEAIVLDALE